MGWKTGSQRCPLQHLCRGNNFMSVSPVEDRFDRNIKPNEYHRIKKKNRHLNSSEYRKKGHKIINTSFNNKLSDDSWQH